MDILILGGGVFLGAATVLAALARGHSLTVFNRGKARQAWPAGVEVLQGDRRRDLSALAGRRWSAVVDCCGYTPAEVRQSAQALGGCGLYLFVSSVSVYASTRHAPVNEGDALASAEGIAPDDADLRHYGPQKAACEAEVSRVFGDKALLVRPGLIVGPGDRSGRFSHWPWRVMEGGQMLLPDVADGEPLQFIDVRDLAEFMVGLLERGAGGSFNATGPVGKAVCDWRQLLATCRTEAQARGLAPASEVRVSEDFLARHGVQPWSELPLWLPSSDAGYAGFNRIALSRAAALGLRTRPLRDTVAAVMDEGVPPPDDKRRAGKLTREREAGLLAGLLADLRA